MENIIIHPSDFSDCSKTALEYAIQLANLSDAELLLVHAFDLNKMEGYDQSGHSLLARSKEIEDESRKQLTEMGESAVGRGIKCRAQLYRGKLISWLPKVIRKIQARLVVMGTTGAGSFSNKVFGSNTYAIIQSSSAPVMAIPNAFNFTPPKRILLATDLRSVSFEALQFCYKFTSMLKAKLKIIYVIQENQLDESQSLLKKRRREFDKIEGKENVNYQIIIGEHYIKSIGELVENDDPDIFAMVVSNKNFVEKLLYGSLSKSMIHRSKTPLLAIPKSLSMKD